jgi:hypothetical protein
MLLRYIYYYNQITYTLLDKNENDINKDKNISSS